MSEIDEWRPALDVGLRWQWRGGERVLQQCWVCCEASEAARYEWRDVPTIGKPEVAELKERPDAAGINYLFSPPNWMKGL